VLGSTGDGDARVRRRTRRVVAVVVVVVLSVLSGCTLRGRLPDEGRPEPTGKQVDPIEANVPWTAPDGHDTGSDSGHEQSV
jgi:hypothetical protein